MVKVRVASQEPQRCVFLVGGKVRGQLIDWAVASGGVVRPSALKHFELGLPGWLVR